MAYGGYGGIPGLPGENAGSSYFGGLGVYGGIRDFLARMGERQGYRAPAPPAPPSAPQPSASAPVSTPVVPGQTKDDLEPSRQIQAPSFAPAAGPGTGVPFRSPEDIGKEGPHIRYSLPSPGGGMGPMEDYDLNAGAPYAGEGGFMGAQGHQGGGGFMPSSTPIIGKTAMGNPEFDWSGVANPEAFDSYTSPIRDAMMAAERARAEKLITDPMYEERQKADIWAQAQGKAQAGIRESLMGDRPRKVQAIIDAVNAAMPGATQEERDRIIRQKVDELDMVSGFESGSRVPTVGGYPG